MPRSAIYLDAPSATPLRPEVRDAVLPWLDSGEPPPNMNAAHRGGRAARRAVEDAREAVASWLGVSAGEIVFTSGGTEANVLAIQGLAEAHPDKRHILSTGLEHPSVASALRALAERGWQVEAIRHDEDGRLDLEHVRKALRNDTVMVATHAGNHDIGTLQPLRELGQLGEDSGVPVFCDGTFSAGWTSLKPSGHGLKVLSLAPYRFFGPQGVGIVWKHAGVPLKPLMTGGRQEGGLRAGTASTAAIAGAGAAARLAQAEEDQWQEASRERSVWLLEQLKQRIRGVRLFGAEPGPGRLPHHLSVAFTDVEGEALMLNLDVAGVAVTAGAGCLPASEKSSPVLRELGVEGRQALELILMGPLPDLPYDQLEEAVTRIVKGVERLRSMSPGVTVGS